jgi:hypothetical protein
MSHVSLGHEPETHQHAQESIAALFRQTASPGKVCGRQLSPPLQILNHTSIH